MVPKSVAILQDHMGYYNRVKALQNAHPNVIAVAPESHPHDHVETFPIPHAWLPTDNSPILRKCWWKADAMALNAVNHLMIDADYYWFTESDVVASQERWQALFADHEDNTSDCVSLPVGRRNSLSRFRHWDHPGTPADADRHFIMAVYRLSRAAVEESIRRAYELRNCFSEVAVPYVVRQAGMSMSLVNRGQKHFTGATMGTKPEHVRMNTAYLNHPVKSNTYSPR